MACLFSRWLPLRRLYHMSHFVLFIVCISADNFPILQLILFFCKYFFVCLLLYGVQLVLHLLLKGMRITQYEGFDKLFVAIEAFLCFGNCNIHALLVNLAFVLWNIIYDPVISSSMLLSRMSVAFQRPTRPSLARTT